MSLLTHERINEYAAKMGVVIKKVSAGPKNLNALVNHIKKTDMCGGFIITQGPDRIQFRDGYDLNHTHLYQAHRVDTDELIGFVMFADKFLKSHHSNADIDHPNFKDKSRKISVVLDICAAPERTAERRRREQSKNLEPINGIRGVGTLLMFLALVEGGRDGSVLFVSQKPLRVKVGTRGKPSEQLWYSTPSGTKFYEKMDFEEVFAYDKNGVKMGGSQIRYRDHQPTQAESDAFMRKYTGSARRISKQPHPRVNSPSPNSRSNRTPSAKSNWGRSPSPSVPSRVSSASRSSNRTPSAKSNWGRTPSPSVPSRVSSVHSRRPSSARSSVSRHSSVDRHHAHAPAHAPAHAHAQAHAPAHAPARIYCGNNAHAPPGRPRGTLLSCFKHGVGVGMGLARNRPIPQASRSRSRRPSSSRSRSSARSGSKHKRKNKINHKRR